VLLTRGRNRFWESQGRSRIRILKRIVGVETKKGRKTGKSRKMKERARWSRILGHNNAGACGKRKIRLRTRGENIQREVKGKMKKRPRTADTPLKKPISMRFLGGERHLQGEEKEKRGRGKTKKGNWNKQPGDPKDRNNLSYRAQPWTGPRKNLAGVGVPSKKWTSRRLKSSKTVGFCEMKRRM